MRYKYTGTINLSVGKVTNVKVSGVVIWKSVATCLQVNKICESNKILGQKPSQVFFFFFNVPTYLHPFGLRRLARMFILGCTTLHNVDNERLFHTECAIGGEYKRKK